MVTTAASSAAHNCASVCVLVAGGIVLVVAGVRVLSQARRRIIVRVDVVDKPGDVQSGVGGCSTDDGEVNNQPWSGCKQAACPRSLASAVHVDGRQILPAILFLVSICSTSGGAVLAAQAKQTASVHVRITRAKAACRRTPLPPLPRRARTLKRGASTAGRICGCFFFLSHLLKQKTSGLIH